LHRFLFSHGDSFATSFTPFFVERWGTRQWVLPCSRAPSLLPAGKKPGMRRPWCHVDGDTPRKGQKEP
jgi:hypothetical protein